MKKTLKIAGKCIFSGVLFAVCFCLISYIMGDEINIMNIIGTTFMYTVFLFLIYVVSPYVRRILGFKEKK